MADQTQSGVFLAALRNLGGSAGNAKLRETLGWSEEPYEAVKQALLGEGAIALGRGRGGSVVLAGDERPVRADKSSKPEIEPADDAVATSVRSELAIVRVGVPRQGKLTLQQLEAHLWGAANILRGKTAGQDYKNYILSLMFYKRLCDQWEREADYAIAELEREQGRGFSEKEKAIFRKRGEHRFQIPDGSRWGDVKAASINLGGVLTNAMRAVANANDELRGVFTVDWNQPAPDGSGKPLIPNEVVHALIQHFDEHDLSNKSVPSDVLGRAYEYLIKQFADDAGAKAGEFFTPPRKLSTRLCAFSSRDRAIPFMTPPPGREECWFMRRITFARRDTVRQAPAISRRK
jgi:hypothetical protein